MGAEKLRRSRWKPHVERDYTLIDFGGGVVGTGIGTPSATKTLVPFGGGVVGTGMGTPSATSLFRHSLLPASG